MAGKDKDPSAARSDSALEKHTQYAGSGSAIIFDIIISFIFAVLVGLFGGLISGIVVFFFVLLITLALSIRVISQWNRMTVLRFGKYQGVIGPGFVTILPIVESTPVSVDLRVISTTFRAEKTLTRDNVPVDVDAILFWKIVNPENAVLNVQSYSDAVQLASQTALRDIIGKHALSEMLAGRDVIGKDIKELIEERVETWGIVAISVEIRDVQIPQELQNAMARLATSEREKLARVVLAESESLAADKMLEAAGKYKKDPYAMQLRSLNMMYEISLSGKNLMVFIPTEERGFSIPTPVGVMGLRSLKEMNDRMSKGKSKRK